MSVVDDLRWKRFPVGSDGFVCLVDVMGDDSSVVQAAAVSYGNDQRDGKENDNEGLIRYLMRHNHGTPFEMCEVKLLVRVPMDTWRQWIRHRTANVNEYSTRYKPAIDSMAITAADEWRLQSDNNKQGSDGFLNRYNPVRMDGEDLSDIEDRFHKEAKNIYQIRLQAGVAREQARKDLPLSTYTEAYWKCDLRNIFHFLGLRMDSHAQLEIRQYATIIAREIIHPLFPQSYQAFLDYQLNAMTLSALDCYAIQTQSLNHFTNKREKEECLKKLERLGINLPSPSK
jgi:thymidylate synthase (FAD)